MKVTASMFNDETKTPKECFDDAKKTKYKQVRPAQTREERMAERVIKTLESQT